LCYLYEIAQELKMPDSQFKKKLFHIFRSGTQNKQTSSQTKKKTFTKFPSGNLKTHSPVSQGRDDESVCAAQEFILIRKVDISDGHHTFVSLLTEVES